MLINYSNVPNKICFNKIYSIFFTLYFNSIWRNIYLCFKLNISNTSNTYCMILWCIKKTVWKTHTWMTKCQIAIKFYIREPLDTYPEEYPIIDQVKSFLTPSQFVPSWHLVILHLHVRFFSHSSFTNSNRATADLFWDNILRFKCCLLF